MTSGKGPKTGERECKCCGHPGRVELDAMLLNGAKYSAIIARMKAAHPEAPELTAPNLSRHKNTHLLTQPIKVTDEEGQEGYLVGHLTGAITVNKKAIPAEEERVSVPDALAVIINAGVRNIMLHPELVTPQVLAAALEMARKIGMGGREGDEFKQAWTELGKKKAERKRVTRKRTVVAEETTTEEVVPEQEAPQGAVVEGAVVAPEEWSPDELRLLGAGKEESDAAGV